MGCSVELYRASIGTFAFVLWTLLKRKANIAKMRVRGLKLRTYSAAMSIATLLVLLMIGGVEPNPGPDRQQTLRQTRLASASTSSATPSRNTGPDTEQSAFDEQGNITEIMKMLRDMSEKMNSMDNKMDEINRKVNEQIESVIKDNKEMKEKMAKLEEKIDELEGRSRRNNLLFHGIPQPKGHTESWKDCEEAVKKVIRDKMGVEEEVEIERAHRLRGGKTPQPVIVLFSRFKQKEAVFSARYKLKDCPELFVSEDFTPSVRERRRQLLPFLKDAKKNGKRAQLRFDTLVVEGRSYVYDSASKQLRERRGKQ